MIDDNFSFQNTSKMVEWLSPLIKLLLIFDDKDSPHKKGQNYINSCFK